MPEFTTPLSLKSGVIFPNRLMMAPMTTTQSFHDGSITQDEIAYYADRSAGLGAVITGAANVTADGRGWSGELSIANDAFLPGLAQLAGAIRARGARPIIQLFHAGRMTTPAVLGGRTPVSASAVAAQRPDSVTPRALTSAEIAEIVAAFGAATRRAIQAGFAGVELHGANTYLLQQFFSPQTNRRTDEYGGSRLARYHFIEQVLDAVFAAVDQYADHPFAVGYRVSPLEFETPGIRFDDTLWLLDQLATTRLDYVHLSLNNHRRTEQGADDQRTLLTRSHEVLAGRLPLVGVGGVRTRADVTDVLSMADAVAVGQQILYDPTWAAKLITGQDDDMVSSDYADALKTTPLSKPLRDFAGAMVQARAARRAAYRKAHPKS